MKEPILKVLDVLGLAYWVEIITDNPKCTYYFGPFVSKEEAQTSYGGYVEDLYGEGAKDIKVQVKRCKPHKLTLFDEVEDIKKFKSIPSLSGQAL
ncbi:DUF1816 domain-containing protein [Aphanothece sacrum]|uniref:DUF1816 domain-containing protein n=1 Tax=Aphanothece sacrum FPU1 TaxID=1920663 RepID=A0A401IGG6_APHSA|nr:DUF1816 domain-containing protein [Aphanothece sacrum]GBF80382.1 hypothetical protein AsFPU1_1783 [Aphanothece sacrum FPU1]